MPMRILFPLVLFFLTFFPLKNYAQIRFEQAQSYTDSALYRNGYTLLRADYNQDFRAENLWLSVKNNKNQLCDGTGNVITSIINNEGGNSAGACVADIDGDGDLDLFIHSIFGQANSLFRQDAPGVYSKVLNQPITKFDNNAFSASFADIDADADQDLIITDTELWDPSKQQRRMSIWLNNGQGVFSQQANSVFKTPLSNTRSFVLLDYNNDDLLDILQLNFGSSNRLFLQRANNQWEENYSEWDNEKDDWLKGHFYDLNADGKNELVLLTLSAELHVYEKVDAQFKKILNLRSNANLASAFEIMDVNFDALPDLVISQQGSTDKKVLLNKSTAGKPLVFRLRASKANEMAIGSKIKVYSKGENEQEGTWQIREISVSSSLGNFTNSIAFFGMGNADYADSVVVFWADGSIQSYGRLASNATYLIEQLHAPQIIPGLNMLLNFDMPINDLLVMASVDTLRMGEASSLHLQLNQNGLVKSNAVLQVDFSIPVEYINAYPRPTTVEGSKMRWEFDQMAPGEMVHLLMNFKNSLDGTLIGKEQSIIVRAANALLDENLENNKVVIRKVVQ